ncbi:methyltransferase-like protein 25 [Copidosoma floridanum]|uniref:methyltransferase-like protein 25 n=1 Tax=Copidosoma floridanum TaxID=29053 RepID=UPI0006C9C5C2|nr:methyltransferase-like protein 25 [Copidosoma floridanum]
MTLERHFSKTIDFIENNEKLISCHLVDFFTNDLWEKCMPNNLISYVEKTGCNSLGEIQQFNVSNTLDEETILHSYLKDSASLRLENCSSAISRSEFMKILNSKPQKSVAQPLRMEHMKAKKWHEVEIFTKTVAWLVKDESCIVIDAGAGKGYSSAHLANHYGLPVLAVECSQANHIGALNRCDLVNKKNKSTEIPICYEIEEISENTDFLRMVEKRFPDLYKKKNLTMVALHGCGLLSDCVVKAFLKTNEIIHLCVVPCCYHLSSKLLTSEYELCKNSRMLAQQSKERMREKSYVLSPSLFYRAVLQVLLRFIGVVDYRVGRGAPSDSFLTYAKWVLNKIDKSKDLSDETIVAMYKKYEIYQWKFNFFQLLRIQLAPIVEAAILLDKYLFLRQSKICADLQIVQLFDPLVSPRSWAIIATK